MNRNSIIIWALLILLSLGSDCPNQRVTALESATSTLPQSYD